MEDREITEDRFIECMAIDFPNFKITKSSLTHPTSQFVISFYSLILRNIMDLTDPDEVWNVTENQRGYINLYHPEAVSFGQHVWVHNLHATIKYVFNHLSENGSEFVYSDILFPENTPRRSFVFMALMLNFYWYSNDFASDLDTHMTACLEAVEVKEKLKQEREKLLNQLKELELQKCQYAESYKDNKKLAMKSAEENQEKELLMKELLAEEEVIKKEVEKIEEEEQNLQATLTELQNDKQYFESLIVSNENQVKDVYEKHLVIKNECVEKMKILEKQVLMASSRLAQSKKVLELQKKLNLSLKEEQFLPDSQGKHKSFQDLYYSIGNLIENKNKLLEAKVSQDQKIIEAEEAIAKLKREYLKLEAEQQDIVAKGKEKIDACKNIVNDLKKSHSQLLVTMRRDSEQTEEIAASTSDLCAECNKLEIKMDSIDSKNRNTYKNYAKEMKLIFESLEGIFGEQKNDVLNEHFSCLEGSQ